MMVLYHHPKYDETFEIKAEAGLVSALICLQEILIVELIVIQLNCMDMHRDIKAHLVDGDCIEFVLSFPKIQYSKISDMA